MKRIWEFISLASQSRTTALLVILVIGASIPLTVLVAQKQQEIRQQAAPDYISSLDNTQLTQTFTDPIDGKTIQVTEQQKAAIEAVYSISSSGTGVSGTKEYDRMRQAFTNGPVGDCIANCGGVTVAQTPAITAGGTATPPPTCTLSTNPNPTYYTGDVSTNYKTTLTWTSKNATSCKFSISSGGGAETNNPPSGQTTEIVYPAISPKTYSLICSGPAAQNVTCASVKITANPAPVGAAPIATPAAASTATPAAIPAVASTGVQAPAACAQFSQYCNSAGQCNWGTLPGTSACYQVVTSYYQTCLKASGNLAPQVESICLPSAAGSTTSVAGSTTLSLTVGLNGVGKTGDRKAPGARTPLANEKSPRSSIQASVFISDGKTVVSGGTISNVILTYDASLGKYKGTATIPASITGAHDIRIKVPGHLIKKIGTTTGAAQTLSGDLIAGDINADNSLSILDYNMLIACWLKGASDSGCQGRSEDADLNVDGIADQLDYNLWLREFALIEGD